MGSIANENNETPTPLLISGFTVTVVKNELVAAALPVQEHWLPQSNLDLLVLPLDVGVFFCYSTAPAGGMDAAVAGLKNGLAQVLVSYYALAGEVVMSSSGEPELLCNNRGVEFSEAYADVELRELDLYKPDESVGGKLVPRKKDGVLAVQVTGLRCGGIMVGCSFDHRIADAYSFNMFLVSWAESARSQPISIHPSFRRSLVNPRHPLSSSTPILDDMYIPVSSLPPPSSDDPTLKSRIYHVKSEELVKLQELANTHGNKNRFSKLESFCAYLWKLVAKSAHKDDVVSKLGIVVDGRSRLGDQMRAYFGNVISVPYGGKRVNELDGSSLGQVAGWVHEFLERGANREHFVELIDWVEVHRPEPTMPKIVGIGSAEGPALVVSSGRGFPVSRVDFGWGPPTFGSYHFPWGSTAGYVMPMPSPNGKGDWMVYMYMLKEQLELIEREAASVFRPFTWDYVV
ncbi:unnamed protein product [Linum trigynum]|uniref:Uncharacterized protein n=1 Tax=Linum trigynum TaxID=586398 RepID=A0AAV2FRI1_9ROSI